MNYKEDVLKGDILYVTHPNPMNSGLVVGEKVIVLDVTCTGDPVVCSFNNEHLDYLSRRRDRSTQDAFIKLMGYKKHTLYRYCLERVPEGSDIEDEWLNNKLERLGI
jgi:hypothetical protein